MCQGLLYSVPQGEHKNIVLVKKAVLRHAGRIFRLAGERASVLRDFLRGHRRDGGIREVFGGGYGVRRIPLRAKLGKLKKGKLTQHVILS